MERELIVVEANDVDTYESCASLSDPDGSRGKLEPDWILHQPH
jgi:hypothetical protein